jgi:phage repressor protein C with HTH and peptisase S24 domain
MTGLTGENGAGPRPTVGEIVASRRAALGLSLQQLAQRAGCAKSYLSMIEQGRRAAPPGEEILSRLESSLGLGAGALAEAARWQETPREVKAEVERLSARDGAARRLAEILSAGAGEKKGLDAAYRSGELRRLIERIAPGEGAPSQGPRSGRLAEPAPGRDVERVRLPFEVPLINKVAAGYPREFTDLGYPVGAADEYVRCPDLQDPDAFACRVVGDSMLPDYREGDIVVFSPARAVRDGSDCFARIEPDHESTFKRVFFETGAAGEELIRLKPLNPAYPQRVLDREQVAGLYAAVSVMRAIG